MAESLRDAVRIEQPLQRLDALRRLSQDQPRSVSIMVHLGRTYGQLGDVAAAMRHLTTARERLTPDRSGRDDELVADLYTALASILYQTGDVEAAIAATDEGIEKSVRPDARLEMVHAYILAHAGDAASSVELYDRLSGRADVDFGAVDLEQYANALMQLERHARFLEVSYRLELEFGYRFGQGLMRSRAYEAKGKLVESYVSAFQDMDYYRFTGRLTDGDTRDNVVNMQGMVMDSLPADRRELFQAVVSILDGYLAEEFSGDVDPDLAIGPAAGVFWQYIAGVYSIRGPHATAADFSRYVQLERRMAGFPGFYYHMWNGMKSGPGRYNFRTVNEVLEQAVVFAGDSSYGARSRRELGDLLGLTPLESEKLLTPREMEILSTGLRPDNLSSLDRFLSFLELPDTVYTGVAIQVLYRVAEHAAVQEYLQTQLPRYSDRVGRIVARVLP